MARIIDLTRPLATGMPTYPGIFSTFVGPYLGHADSIRAGGISVCHSVIVLSDHAGTHLDAPLHFDPKGKSIEKTPLELAYGPGVVLDFSYKAARDSVTAQEMEAAFKALDVSEENIQVVLIKTGADPLYGTPDYFNYYLEIKREAVIWLVEAGIMLFGVDAATIDHSHDRATHMLIREREFYHMENLTHLDELPAKGFLFAGFPLPLRGASASPIRAVAILGN